MSDQPAASKKYERLEHLRKQQATTDSREKLLHF